MMISSVCGGLCYRFDVAGYNFVNIVRVIPLFLPIRSFSVIWPNDEFFLHLIQLK